MTGLVRRTGVGVGVVKTVLEVAVVAAGWLLGGTLGWSTLAYAFGVGVVVQACTRALDLGPAGRRWWRRAGVVSPPRAPTPRRAGTPPAPAPRAGART